MPTPWPQPRPVKTNPATAGLRPQSFADLVQFANLAAKSSMVPPGYKGQPESIVLAVQMGDRTRAAKSFVAALDERPDDRKILTKLMQLYSEEKDWSKLIEVVIKLASKVDDKKQKAKYLHTAAIVSARQLTDLDQAA